MKKLNLYTATFVIVIAMFLFAAIHESRSNEGFEKLNRFALVHKESLAIKDSLGDNSTYAQYYIRTRIADEIDVSPGSLSPEEQIIEDKALQYYARKNGVVVSDEEVKALMDETVAMAIEDDTFSQKARIFERNGISFEDTVYRNETYYRMDCLRGKLYNEVVGTKKTGLATNEEYEKQHKDDIARWEDFVKRTVAEYKVTDDYAEVVHLLNEADKTMNSKSGKMRKIPIPGKGFPDIPYFH